MLTFPSEPTLVITAVLTVIKVTVATALIVASEFARFILISMANACQWSRTAAK
jgi:hypothetical protein